MYDTTEQKMLLDKVGYEIWLLDFLAKRWDLYEGGTDISLIQLTNNEPNANFNLSLTNHIGAGTALSIMNAMTPLTFTASFKMLDMIFEWILERNHCLGKIPKVPWPFKEKLKFLKNRSDLIFPPLFMNKQYLHDYSEALFSQLLPYRNEIVHNKNFSVSDSTLTVLDSKNNSSLSLNRVQIGCLVRFVIALVRALAGTIAVDTYTDNLFRYHLDILTMVHGLAPFNQQEPLLIHVELTMPKDGNSFIANLKQVRDTVKRSYLGKDVFFNLTVLAVEGENLIAKWDFVAKEVPTLDFVNLEEDTYEKYRFK